MYDVEVTIRCDGCHRDSGDEASYCYDCYEKIKAERDALKSENEQLRAVLARHGIEEEKLPVHPVYLCPALIEMLHLTKKAASW